MGVGGGQVRFKTANEYKAIQSLQSAMVTDAWKTTGMGVHDAEGFETEAARGVLNPVVRRSGLLVLLSYLFPGLPGLAPGPSLTFGFPGGWGSMPLPRPLLPFSLSFSSVRTEPFDANQVWLAG